MSSGANREYRNDISVGTDADVLDQWMGGNWWKRDTVRVCADAKIVDPSRAAKKRTMAPILSDIVNIALSRKSRSMNLIQSRFVVPPSLCRASRTPIGYETNVALGSVTIRVGYVMLTLIPC